MIKQHLAIAHGDHVVVEHTLIDHRWRLLGVDHALIAQAMQTGNRLRSFQGLPRRVALRGREAAVEGAAAKDEELHTGIAVAFAEARVVSRAFITKLTDCRQSRVVSEVLLIGEHRTEHATGGRVFDRAVEFAVEVGGGEMHATVRSIGTRADSAGVGRPHTGGRAAGDQQRHGVFRGLLDHLRVSAGKTQAAQHGDIRAFLRGQYALLEAHFHQGLHLGQALLGGFLRVGRRLAVALRGDVAVGQATVVVSRPDQPIKIHFK